MKAIKAKKEKIHTLKEIENQKSKKKGKRGRKKQDDEYGDDKKGSDEDDDDDMDDDDDSDSPGGAGGKDKPSLTRAGSKINNISSGNIFDIDFESSMNRKQDNSNQQSQTLNHLLKKPSLDKSKVSLSRSNSQINEANFAFTKNIDPYDGVRQGGDAKMIPVNIFSSADPADTNNESNQTRRISRKHLIHMLENDKRYRNSDLLYTCYLD